MDEQLDQIVTWCLHGNPAPPPHLIKMKMLEHAIRQSRVKVFVETGTYHGDTTATIAALGVKVITIELAPHHHANALKRFADTPNVTCLFGDSTHLLPGILEDLAEPACFWLDGHYSEGDTACGDRETPLIEELFAILHHDRDDHIVLIDDVRAFGTTHYPTVPWTKQLIRQYWSGSQIDILHDIMRIRPSHLKLVPDASH